MVSSEYANLVAERVNAAMGDMSVVKLAEATGIPRVTLMRRLGRVTPFTVTELDAISQAIGVDVTELTAAVA